MFEYHGDHCSPTVYCYCHSHKIILVPVIGCIHFIIVIISSVFIRDFAVRVFYVLLAVCVLSRVFYLRLCQLHICINIMRCGRVDDIKICDSSAAYYSSVQICAWIDIFSLGSSAGYTFLLARNVCSEMYILRNHIRSD